MDQVRITTTGTCGAGVAEPALPGMSTRKLTEQVSPYGTSKPRNPATMF